MGLLNPLPKHFEVLFRVLGLLATHCTRTGVGSSSAGGPGGSPPVSAATGAPPPPPAQQALEQPGARKEACSGGAGKGGPEGAGQRDNDRRSCQSLPADRQAAPASQDRSPGPCRPPLLPPPPSPSQALAGPPAGFLLQASAPSRAGAVLTALRPLPRFWEDGGGSVGPRAPRPGARPPTPVG